MNIYRGGVSPLIHLKTRHTQDYIMNTPREIKVDQRSFA